MQFFGELWCGPFIVAMKSMLVNRVIPKVIWSVFGPAFTPYYTHFQWSLQSKEIFIKSQYEMLKLSI
jgi:hypothetical protein